MKAPPYVHVPAERVLRHILNTGADRTTATRCRRLPAAEGPPTFTGPFYLADIGPPGAPLLLELRLVPVDGATGLALLMTNERYPRDLAAMGAQIQRAVESRGVTFDGIVAPESLGTKLTQEIARNVGPWTLHTTLQKGKLVAGADGNLTIVPPKAWIGENDGVPAASATTGTASRQRLYLDPAIAERFRTLERGVLLVDDARLSSGTLNASIALLKKHEVPIAAVATVLNEHDSVETIDGVPYVYLTKLPLFDRVEGDRWRPRPGTYEGLEHFWMEDPVPRTGDD